MIHNRAQAVRACLLPLLQILTTNASAFFRHGLQTISLTKCDLNEWKRKKKGGKKKRREKMRGEKPHPWPLPGEEGKWEKRTGKTR